MRKAKFLQTEELADLGFAAIGDNVLIHETVVLAGVERIRLGSNVRIDPHCVISGGEEVSIGSYVHIAAHVLLVGGGGITLADFSGISHGAKLLSVSDDFSGGVLTGPTVPADLRNVSAAPIVVGRHAVVGANAVLLPGTRMEDGATLGALSLGRGVLEGWKVHAGTPARIIGSRDREGVLRAEAVLRDRQA